MHLLIVFGLFATSLAAPHGSYSAPAAGGIIQGSGISVSGGGFPSLQGGYRAPSSGEFIQSGGGFVGGLVGGCGQGQVRHVDGSCVQPVVTRNVYLYSAPQLPVHAGPRLQVPRPRVEYNIVFVRTPDGPVGQRPIVVPPPQQKTLVYVLTRGGQLGGQRVIEVPAGPDQAPEVFYVNYNEGDNPQLAGGIDLQSALASASAQQGRLIQGGSGGSTGGVYGGGIIGGTVGGSIGGSIIGGAISGGRPSTSYRAP